MTVTTSRSLFSCFLVALALVAGCGGGTGGTPAGDAGSDAGGADDGGADAGPRMLSFRAGPDYPTGIAYARAVILPVGADRYLYVIGGADATRASLGAITAACFRAPIMADGTLGAWEDAGPISTMTGQLPLVGHGALRLNGEMGEIGVGVAGGGSSSGALPVVLGAVVQPDGTLGHWGKYDPILDMGQSFGAFVAFEAHQLALVGGLTGDTPTDQVRIAAIMNGAMSPTWRPGPTLPEARFGQASFAVGTTLYMIGGENASGTVSPVLMTTRDATTLDVNGWTSAGSLTPGTSFLAATAHGGQAWVFGGMDGGRATGSVSARVSRADIGADGHLGTFMRVPGGDLPTPVAASAFAYDDVTGHVYLVGGLTGEPLASTTGVIVGTLP
jgi:hypothetical protein